MKIETGPITVVEWIDSLMTDFAPVTEKDLECAVITSTGYLVKETDEYVALARDYSDTSEHWRGVVCIPKVAIRSREVALMAGGVLPREAAPVTVAHDKGKKLYSVCPACGLISRGDTEAELVENRNGHVQRVHMLTGEVYPSKPTTLAPVHCPYCAWQTCDALGWSALRTHTHEAHPDSVMVAQP